MKKILVLSLLIWVNSAQAEVEFVPLEMELGYWEVTSQVNIDDMLANVPQEQRAMMRQMMTSKIESTTVKQCITEDTHKNMQTKMMDSFNSANGNCALQVTESTNQVFIGVVTCDESKTTINIATTVINSKRHESQVSTNAGGLGQTNIQTVGEWKSATCPDGV